VWEDKRPALFERSEFAGRPQRTLAALDIGAGDFMAVSQRTGRFTENCWASPLIVDWIPVVIFISF